jgi:hypothetical protein
MPVARGVAEQFESSGEVALPIAIANCIDPIEPPAAAVPKVAVLLATIAALQDANAKLRAERRPLPAEWMTIKEAAYRAGIVYEAMRLWVNRQRVESRREDGLIFVNVASLDARLARLGRAPR